MTERFTNKAGPDGTAIERRARDFDDLQNELAGREVGRRRRFLNGSSGHGANGAGAKAAKDRLQRTLDWLLLNDAGYARVHADLMDTLVNAEHAAQSALSEIFAELDDIRAAIETTLDSAASLPDGTKVFRDVNGQLRKADGSTVSADLAATIIWRGDEPGYEDLVGLKDREADLQTAADELWGIEARLGGIRDRSTTKDEPLNMDGIKAAADDADALRDRILDIQTGLSRQITSQPDPTLENAKIDAAASIDRLSDIPTVTIGTKP